MSSGIGPVTRAHEWLADHFSFVQYPNIRAQTVRRQEPRARQLPVYQRAGLFFFGTILVIGGGGLLALLLWFVYCCITA